MASNDFEISSSSSSCVGPPQENDQEQVVTLAVEAEGTKKRPARESGNSSGSSSQQRGKKRQKPLARTSTVVLQSDAGEVSSMSGGARAYKPKAAPKTTPAKSKPAPKKKPAKARPKKKLTGPPGFHWSSIFENPEIAKIRGKILREAMRNPLKKNRVRLPKPEGTGGASQHILDMCVVVPGEICEDLVFDQNIGCGSSLSDNKKSKNAVPTHTFDSPAFTEKGGVLRGCNIEARHLYCLGLPHSKSTPRNLKKVVGGDLPHMPFKCFGFFVIAMSKDKMYYVIRANEENGVSSEIWNNPIFEGEHRGEPLMNSERKKEYRADNMFIADDMPNMTNGPFLAPVWPSFVAKSLIQTLDPPTPKAKKPAKKPDKKPAKKPAKKTVKKTVKKSAKKSAKKSSESDEESAYVKSSSSSCYESSGYDSSEIDKDEDNKDNSDVSSSNGKDFQSKFYEGSSSDCSDFSTSASTQNLEQELRDQMCDDANDAKKEVAELRDQLREIKKRQKIYRDGVTSRMAALKEKLAKKYTDKAAERKKNAKAAESSAQVEALEKTVQTLRAELESEKKNSKEKQALELELQNAEGTVADMKKKWDEERELASKTSASLSEALERIKALEEAENDHTALQKAMDDNLASACAEVSKLEKMTGSLRAELEKCAQSKEESLSESEKKIASLRAELAEERKKAQSATVAPPVAKKSDKYKIMCKKMKSVIAEKDAEIEALKESQNSSEEALNESADAPNITQASLDVMFSMFKQHIEHDHRASAEACARKTSSGEPSDENLLAEQLNLTHPATELAIVASVRGVPAQRVTDIAMKYLRGEMGSVVPAINKICEEFPSLDKEVKLADWTVDKRLNVLPDVLSMSMSSFSIWVMLARSPNGSRIAASFVERIQNYLDSVPPHVIPVFHDHILESFETPESAEKLATGLSSLA